MMGRIIKGSIIISVLLFSCATSNHPCPEVKLDDWNKICLDTFRLKYNNFYQEYYKINCEKEIIRDMHFDYNRKISVLLDYNFNAHLKMLMKEIYCKSKFDSIIAINLFDHSFDETEFPTFTTNFLVYSKKNKIKQYDVSEHDQILSFDSKNAISKRIYQNSKNKKDSCDCGLIVFTKLDKNLKINSIKILINPENIFDIPVTGD